MRNTYIIANVIGGIGALALFLHWWLPGKWQGCQRIYDSKPAQIVCFLKK